MIHGSIWISTINNYYVYYCIRTLIECEINIRNDLAIIKIFQNYYLL